ncbi:hypothetical protein L6164_026560 [Bauhinia variegata]|uniref:Uncharacterized protein n=1 Tax=Bauhinia variegata TaxID=167791 RepID=A0ACB9LQV6_BAUVA|nr:hypothetical protein L6164_026560 [Bauhinia variegata]
MWRSPGISHIVGRLNQLNVSRVLINHACYTKAVQARDSSPASDLQPKQDQFATPTNYHLPEQKSGDIQKHHIGKNLSKRNKEQHLVNTLLDLNDSKESIYGALDAWVAWDQNFPIGSLKRALNALEKEQQWHRIIQVIKWMLSKGQGTTMGTYGQLIRALDMDHRAEEAHKFWENKIGTDLHSVPWQLCHVMISVYYRNNRLEDLIRLFKGLEAFDRKPPDKLIIEKVANAYEKLGLLEEKQRVLEKYGSLFTEEGPTKKPKRSWSAGKKKSSSTEKGYHKQSREDSSKEK